MDSTVATASATANETPSTQPGGSLRFPATEAISGSSSSPIAGSAR
jgi:hypothetical protein